MKQQDHPNIVKLLDVFQTPNNIYIVTEFCNSGDLGELMKKKKKFSETIALRIIQDILRGMQELSRHGITHRDLKPANIMINDGVFKLTDFGFAKKVDDVQDLMKSQVGTPLYMSPQILMHQPYTSKCDVWSFGLIFYELLYGETPWPAQNIIELINKIIKKPVIFPRHPLVSEPAKMFIKRCLILDEKDRYGWEEICSSSLFNGLNNE